MAAKSSLPSMRSPEHGQSITQRSVRWPAARRQSLSCMAAQKDSTMSRVDTARAHSAPDSSVNLRSDGHIERTVADDLDATFDVDHQAVATGSVAFDIHDQRAGAADLDALGDRQPT